MEKRGPLGGTRFKITPCNTNVEYIKSIHKFFSSRGKSREDRPKLKRIPVGGNKAGYKYNLMTYTYYSLNEMEGKFYKGNKGGGRKSKPTDEELRKYFNPIALAQLYQSEGRKVRGGAIIALKSYTEEEVRRLSNKKKEGYKLRNKVKVGRRGKGGETISEIYIYKESIERKSKYIKPFKIPSKYSKLKEH